RMETPLDRRVFDLDWFTRVADRRRASDAERPEPPLVSDLMCLGGRDGHDIWRVDPVGQVPQALLASTPGDGDLASGRQELGHLVDVAVVPPARRLPQHRAGVRYVP